MYMSRQQYLHHNPHVHKRVYGVCMTHGLEITKQRETSNRTISYDVLRNDYKCTESIFKIVYIYGLCIYIYIYNNPGVDRIPYRRGRFFF